MEVASHVQKHTSSRGVTSSRAWKAAARRVWALGFACGFVLPQQLAVSRVVRPRCVLRDVFVQAIHV